jgi:hypothetical protein
MKIFNINVRVTATQIAEIPDNPPEQLPPAKEPFNDDPIDKQAKMIDRYMDKMAKLMGSSPVPGLFGPNGPEGGEGATMSRNARIAAGSFDDLTAILQKFSDTLNGLPSVPESLMPGHESPLTDHESRG